jgi:tetratricopeptide (TPR) repeat protein
MIKHRGARQTALPRRCTESLRSGTITSFSRCFIVLMALVLVAPAALAGKAQDRSQALQALTSPSPELRRAALSRLAVVASQQDAAVLLQVLHDDDDRGARSLAETALWRLWSRNDDKKTEKLFQRGVRQLSGGSIREAVTTFGKVIGRSPDFAEAWNKRATAYFMIGEYRKSLRDCDEVIKRNPNHFGALAGYGQIYLRLEQPERALSYFQRALAINPNLDGVSAIIEQLEQLVAQRRERSI